MERGMIFGAENIQMRTQLDENCHDYSVLQTVEKMLMKIRKYLAEELFYDENGRNSRNESFREFDWTKRILLRKFGKKNMADFSICLNIPGQWERWAKFALVRKGSKFCSADSPEPDG